MNKAAILHISESFMAYATGLDKLKIRLRADKKDELDVSLLYTYKCDDPHIWKEVAMEKTFVDEYHAYFEIDNKLRDKRFPMFLKLKIKMRPIIYLKMDLKKSTILRNFILHLFICPIFTKQIFLSLWNG